MDIEKGYIGHFTYNQNGFAVFGLVTDNKTITCTGNASGFGEGETVEVTGEYVNHSTYGRQLKISTIKALEPEDTISIVRYLGSGAIKGIGEALAKRIVKQFGEDTFRIAQEEPERLAEVKGISLKKAYDFGAQIAEKRDMREAMMFMLELGISQNLSSKIYGKYGISVYSVLKENPYKLAEDIDGVGFKIADEIANKSGIPVDSKYRIRCGLLHVLYQTTIDGHCYYPKNELVVLAQDLLGVSTDDLDKEIAELVMDRKIILKKTEDEERIYINTYYFEEVKCAHMLLELRDSYTSPYTEKSNNELRDWIIRTENKLELELDELQREAVIKSLKSGVFVLSGGPGTGKTTTINTIIQILTDEGLDIRLAAPTGRAAKRMTETTGYEAKTIHRLLEISGEVDREGNSLSFGRDEDNPIETDVVIIDEMSMVDIHLLKSLLSAIVPGTKVILVGDVDQLASVGPGQVLKDILDCKTFDEVRLEKIFRQDEDSHIVSYAYKINHGEAIDFSVQYKDFFLIEKDSADVIYHYTDELMRRILPKQFGIKALDTQILSPVKNGPLGVFKLNEIMQERLNPAAASKRECTYGDATYRVGDKVMQIRNNYDLEWEIVGKYNLPLETGKGIFNGDVGYISDINSFLKELTVVYEDGRQAVYSFEQLDELELAYSITIHKSQGSEYPVIIIPLLGGPRKLLTRNLLYTAITRAKNCVILLGSSDAFTEMIKTDMVQKRYTSLGERIIEYNKGIDIS